MNPRRWIVAASFMSSFLFAFPSCNAASIPPFYIDSVVALGALQTATNGVGGGQWMTEGTGFLYGYVVSDDPDPAKRQYKLFLVTARHVVQGHLAANRGDISVRMNPKGTSDEVKQFNVPSQASPSAETWFYSDDPTVDLAIVPLNPRVLTSQGVDIAFFANDQNAANKSKLIDLGIAAGDSVFVLGFPLGLTGQQRNYVIAREGVIARLSEMEDNRSQTFMVDSFVFPGNSGGPVVSKPELISIQGTKSQPAAYLIGVVLNYIPYIDVAISAQTQRPRITFEENSGLTDVLPTDYIDKTIHDWLAKRPAIDGPPWPVSPPPLKQ